MTAEAEEGLIAAARNGSVSAFESLYRMHAARVHGLCVRLCDSRADAQDATQETFIKAWRAMDTFRGGSSFSTWLHRIAFNESIGSKRRQRAKEAHLHVVEAAAVSKASSLADIEQLERALSQLPDRAREAIVLHKVYGYTHEETAEFMGTSVGASKAQVHRAIKLLRAQFPEILEDAQSPPGADVAENGIAND